MRPACSIYPSRCHLVVAQPSSSSQRIHQSTFPYKTSINTRRFGFQTLSVSNARWNHDIKNITSLRNFDHLNPRCYLPDKLIMVRFEPGSNEQIAFEWVPMAMKLSNVVITDHQRVWTDNRYHFISRDQIPFWKHRHTTKLAQGLMGSTLQSTEFDGHPETSRTAWLIAPGKTLPIFQVPINNDTNSSGVSFVSCVLALTETRWWPFYSYAP